MKLLYGVLTLLVSAVFVLATVGGMENVGALASAVYGILITLFLIILVWGFTKTQVSYLKKIEDVKKQVLEVEGVLPCENHKTV
ncbi:MAG: hypothetical protein R3A80_09600 [Bdellovibrionota bacterium]